MAFALKSSGLATELLACVGVDEDSTIVDFVGNAITLGSGVAASVAGTTWKGDSLNYFVTTAAGPFNFNGVTFDSPPSVNENVGVTVMMICAGASAISGLAPFIALGSLDGLSRAAGTQKGTYISGGLTAQTTTDLPTNDSTKFSCAVTYINATSSTAGYGLESGSFANEDTEGSDGGFGGTSSISAIGGAAGQGNQPFRCVYALVFNRALSESEIQSIHNDPFGTLFDAPAGGGGTYRGLLTLGVGS